jgi:hypothetical protein
MPRTKNLALYISSLLLVAGTTGLAVARPFDGTHVPIVVVSDSDSLGANASSTAMVELDGVTTTDQVVSLSSNSQYLAVPSTVTVRAGQSTAYFQVLSGTFGTAGTATITASCNGGSAYTVIGLQ